MTEYYIDNYFKDKYDWKNISQEFSLKNIDETKSFFIEETNKSGLKVESTKNFEFKWI